MNARVLAALPALALFTSVPGAALAQSGPSSAASCQATLTASVAHEQQRDDVARRVVEASKEGNIANPGAFYTGFAQVHDGSFDACIEP